MELPKSPPELPSPPFHQVPGLANLRDIGGYPVSLPSSPSTCSISLNRLYRSADPSRVTSEGLSVLQHTLKIRKVFDLRSVPEIQRVGAEWAGVAPESSSPFYSTSTEPASGTSPVDGQTNETLAKAAGASTSRQDAQGNEKLIERIWTPVFASQDYSPEKVGLRFQAYTRGSEGFVQAYMDILANAGPAYGTILRYLAEEDAEPALVHCTAGKDRTGVLVALILLLLGVDGERVAVEYALTDEGLRLMKPLFRERLLKNEALKGNEGGVDVMIASRKENMLGMIEALGKKYGGAEAYLRSVVGLGDAEIEGLRRNFGSDQGAIL